MAAVIENVSIACGYKRGDIYPPPISIGDHFLLQTPIISPEKDFENINHRIPWRELNRTDHFFGLRDGLIFRVIVSYRGPFTKGHETSQCWRYVGSLDGFAEVPDARYTYSK